MTYGSSLSVFIHSKSGISFSSMPMVKMLLPLSRSFILRMSGSCSRNFVRSSFQMTPSRS